MRTALRSASMLLAGGFAAACAQGSDVALTSARVAPSASSHGTPANEADLRRRLATERTLSGDILAVIAVERVTGQPLGLVAGQSPIDRIAGWQRRGS
ncbi:MAG: hypothetical protein AAF732_23025 [Pseudomonadota bacterium]